MRTSLLTLLVLPGLALGLGLGAPSSASVPAATSGSSGASAITLPPLGTDWDYQLGAARPVPSHVGIVERDRTAKPLAGVYNVCYVNGYQTQVEQKRFWRRHWSLVLKDAGKPVTDSVWGEWLLDTRTAAKRHALAKIMGRWTAGCAAKGFEAVEYDNLDSFSRSRHLLTRRDNKAFAALLVKRAHADGLAAAQKNWAEWDGTSVGFDFAVAEQCGQYRECASYVHSYGDHVLAVEYQNRAFRWTCQHFGDRISVVRRDVDLTRHGVRRWC
jgi:hypothetical protein